MGATGEQHRDQNPGHEVFLSDSPQATDSCRTCPWPDGDQPARPVEDRFPYTEADRVAAFVDATAEREQRIRAEGHAAGFRSGVQVGRAEGEAQQLDAVLQTGPTTYDAACVALEVAARVVHRIDVTGLHTPEAQQLLIDQHGQGMTALADRLLLWLAAHVDPDIDGPLLGQRISEPVMDEVRWATAPRCTSCGSSIFSTHADDCTATGLTPATPGPCPECVAGKHPNCGGRVLDGSDRYQACPCALDNHPESLPS